jgi:2-phosphoglycolate phosphatase
MKFVACGPESPRMIASRVVSLPRAIVFDLDGTLCDSYAPITTSLNAARAAFGLPPVTLQQVKREVGRGLESLVEDHLGADRVADGVAIFRATYATVFLEGTKPLDGVPDVLQRLARRGIELAVASNKPARFGRPIIERLGLAQAVRIVLGPEPEVPPKPEPQMLLRACRELGVTPQQALYVGDMPLDIESARRAGLAYALVATGSADREELEACSNAPVLADLWDLEASLAV